MQGLQNGFCTEGELTGNNRVLTFGLEIYLSSIPFSRIWGNTVAMCLSPWNTVQCHTSCVYSYITDDSLSLGATVSAIDNCLWILWLSHMGCLGWREISADLCSWQVHSPQMNNFWIFYVFGPWSIKFYTCEQHNILEPVLGRPSGYNAKHCTLNYVNRWTQQLDGLYPLWYFFWTWHCQHALVSTVHIPSHAIKVQHV
jgi:hypothetical protein